jgi:hypothetical protein
MVARLTPLFLVVLVALAAGCGGDTRRAETDASEAASQPSGSQAPGPEGRPSEGPVQVTNVTNPARHAYVKRVDAVCGKLDPERAREQQRVGASPDTAGAVKAYDDTIALGWRELRQIRAVPPPPGDAAVLKANVLEPVRAQLELRAKIRNALAAADVPRLRRLRTELDNSTRALTGFARGYGFQVCGEE